jgi:hypothetical protein
MLETVLNYLHNWFPVAGAARAGTFIIVSGTLTLHNVLDGQFYKIEGSVFNDGLHKYGDPEDKLMDETFTGRIVPLAIPKAVIELADSIKKWADENPVSDKVSESFGGYSYTKGGAGTQSAEIGGWQTAFRKELNQWKKVG